jgi:hypothetical protein
MCDGLPKKIDEFIEYKITLGDLVKAINPKNYWYKLEELK